jgi:hypothetical protein
MMNPNDMRWLLCSPTNAQRRTVRRINDYGSKESTGNHSRLIAQIITTSPVDFGEDFHLDEAIPHHGKLLIGWAGHVRDLS